MIKAFVIVAVSFAAIPAFAQSGQTPPSPNSSASTPEPANSAPPNSLTTNPGSRRAPLTTGALGSTTAVRARNGTRHGPSSAFQRTVPAPASR